MGDGTDARIARDRMLGALEGCTDQKTRRSLWRAALRYNERVRSERGRGETVSLLAQADGLGSFLRETGW